MKQVRYSLFVVASLLLAGCQSEPIKPPMTLQVQAAYSFQKDGAKLFWIHKESETLARLGSTGQMRDLSAIIENASTRQVDVACSGPDSASVRRVIVGALELQVSKRPGLRLLYVGPEKERAAIEKAVHETGAIFLYAPGEPVQPGK